MKTLTVALLVLLACHYGLGQTPSDTTKKCSEGTMAILFKIEIENKSFWPTLLAFSGKTFSGTYHFSDSKAIRLGFSASGTTFKRDQTDVTPSPRSESGISLRIESQYLAHLPVSGNLLFYYGAGPIVGYSGFLRRYADSDYRNITWELGLSGVAGMEYILLDRVTILAEYFIHAVYSRYESENRRAVRDKSTWTRFTFDSMPIRLGLSLYF